MSEGEDPLYRIICRRDPDYCLAIRGDKIVFVLINPCDRYQHWIKDERHGSTIKDSEGQPAFALVNKASAQAIAHGPVSKPVPFIRYNFNANSCDESVLWTVSKHEFEGFVNIRRANDISIVFTANDNTIHDGHIFDLCVPEYPTQKTFLWKIQKILPSTCSISFFRPSQQTVRIYCRAKPACNLAIDKDSSTVLLVPSNVKDKYQHWIKETACSVLVKDDEGREAFALVNKATGQAIKHGFGNRYLVQLAPFNQNYIDASLLWTESNLDGFCEIRMQNNTSVVFSVFDPWVEDDCSLLGLLMDEGGAHQQWKIEHFV